MTVLRTAYVLVLPDTDRLEPEMAKALKKINLTGPAGKAGESAGGSFGKRMAGAVTAAFAAAGIGATVSGAITAALDVGAANDKLRAQLNLSKEESGRLGKAAGELYSKGYGDSMGTVNDAIAKVVQAVPSLRDAGLPVLKDIAGGALDIARVFDQDVAGVTGAVSSMLRSGLAPNAQAAMDIITKGLQGGADKGGDFLDTLTEYSVQFTKLGLDAPTSLGVINQLLAGGARNSDLAADALKEFSIRSIDGSKSTAEAFKALGMDAKGMASDLAAGGPTAKAAFGLVVEELNKTKDPLERNRIGVALFGTQWEDLGDAFKNLDVSSATDGLGQVAGATKGIADQSAQARVQGFIRTVQTGFVNVIGGQVLPKITEFAQRLRDNGPLMDRLKDAGTRLSGALRTTGQTIGSVAGFFREHETAAKTLLVTVGALVVATQAHAAVLAVQAAGGLVAWIAQIRIVSAVTKAWAAVQWLINIAMNANPIGLLVVGLAALGGALYLAWQKSSTFRDILIGAWEGIQTAASWAWNSVIKPVVNALVWYFNNVMAPTAMWLWNKVFKPVWAGISWAVKSAWVVIQIALAAFKLYLEKVVFPVVRFLYDNVVKPVFNAVAGVITWWWRTIVTPAFNGVKSAFSALGSAISTVWNKGIKPVFSALGSFVKDKVAPAFRGGVSAISSAWDKLKAAATAPVRFMVDTVLNKGIIGSINWLASKVGVKDRIPTIRWDSGGSSSGGSKPRGDLTGGNTRGDGYGHGGTGDGIGSVLAGPAKWLSDRVGLGKLVQRFGSNPFARTVLGAATRMKDLALDRVKNLAGELLGSGSGGSVGAGGLRSGILGVLGALRGQFGSVPIISGLRPGSTTLSGNRSYHASGRAVDIAPVRAWAEYLATRYGGQLRELITPWRDLNMLNGRHHRYSHAIEAQHGVFGSNAHIHAALDDGGFRTLLPGLNLIPNGTGAREPIAGPVAMRQLAGGSRTYNVNVSVAPGANPAEAGRQIVEAIKAFEAGSGSRWRSR